MVTFDDMTPDERDRFIYLILSEDDLKAIVMIMRKKYGPDVTEEQIMRFAYKVAHNKMIPKKIRDKFKNKKDPLPKSDGVPFSKKIFNKLFE